MVDNIVFNIIGNLLIYMFPKVFYFLIYITVYELN